MKKRKKKTPTVKNYTKKELQDFKRKLDEQKNVEKVNVIYN